MMHSVNTEESDIYCVVPLGSYHVLTLQDVHLSFAHIALLWYCLGSCVCLFGFRFDLVSFGKQFSPGDFPKLKKISKSYQSLFWALVTLVVTTNSSAGMGDPLPNLLEVINSHHG